MNKNKKRQHPKFSGTAFLVIRLTEFAYMN